MGNDQQQKARNFAHTYYFYIDKERYNSRDEMEQNEEKPKKVDDIRDFIISVPSPSELGGPQVVDLRKGRPKEENWSYLIALLIPVLIVIICFVIFR
jgi:hypothetical protein